MKQRMRAFHPGDADRYDDFMRAVEPIYDAVIGDRLGSKPFDRLGGFASFLPTLLKLNAWNARRLVRESVLQGPTAPVPLLVPPALPGGEIPFTGALHLPDDPLPGSGWGGVWFTTGGMYRVVEALATVFQEIGGVIESGLRGDPCRCGGGTGQPGWRRGGVESAPSPQTWGGGW